MKWVTDATGRFRERPYYEEQEIDSECERIVSDFLFDRYGKVEWPVRTDDLTILIEGMVEDLDQFADLSSLGDEVEGVTFFAPNVRPTVKISSALSSTPSLENRLRTTLTHELGHVHFHACLFDASNELSELLGAERRRPGGAKGCVPLLHHCKRETILNARQVDWMEWQAGYACGAFLMPRSSVRSIVRENSKTLARFETISDGTEHASQLIGSLVERFSVSSEAARIRLLKMKAILPVGRGPIEP